MTIAEAAFLCIQMELCRDNLEAFVYNNELGGVEIIKAQGPPRFYQQVFPQILNGLDGIHSMGWVHRDINVSNILIGNTKPSEISEIVVKFADFGLARKIKREFDTFTSLPIASDGKLFKAPEVSSEHYDSKVDIYSAGIVLYFLSRYLQDKTQWTKEIIELRKGNRSLQHLYHQDDSKLSYLFSYLLKNNPSERPTAREALELMRSQDLPKKFLVQKCDHRFWRRCSLDYPTLSGLKEAIESCISINAGIQVLHQQKVIEGVLQLVMVESDQDVQCMFQEAELEKARVLIVVSEKENKSEMVMDSIDVL